MGRTLAGLGAGILTGMAAMLAISLVGSFFYPVAVDPQLRDPVRQIVEAFPDAPLGAKLFVAAAWFGGGLAGALAGARIARRPAVGTLAALFLALAALANIFILPLPAWMQIAALVLPLAGGMVANHLTTGRGAAASA